LDRFGKKKNLQHKWEGKGKETTFKHKLGEKNALIPRLYRLGQKRWWEGGNRGRYPEREEDRASSNKGDKIQNPYLPKKIACSEEAVGDRSTYAKTGGMGKICIGNIIPGTSSCRGNNEGVRQPK